jgi:hypothetical protein
MVHVACCVGNIVADFFRVFRENEGVLRSIRRGVA